MSRRLALALLAVALLGAGAWVWDQTRFPAVDEALAGTPITVRMQAGPSDRGADAFRRGLRIGTAYLRRSGSPLTGPVEARLAHGDPCEPFLEPGRGATGTAKAGRLCVDALVPVWERNVRTRPAVASSIAAHELVHVWQAELGCLPDGDDREYLWLVEGTAVAFSWWALQDGGLVGERETRATIRRWGAFDRRLGALETYEGRGGSDPEYALWHLAVRHLLSERKGDRRLVATRDFCRAVGRGVPWRTAFADAFGVTVGAFYRDFAAALPAYERSRPG